jgi:hypothetical protein
MMFDEMPLPLPFGKTTLDHPAYSGSRAPREPRECLPVAACGSPLSEQYRSTVDIEVYGHKKYMVIVNSQHDSIYG